MEEGRLEKQISFIKELEKLKTVERQNKTLDNGRQENSAEHSWHVALMAAVLSEYSDKSIDISKVILMLLIHDVVEIDFGDVWLYDELEEKGREQKELKCAKRVFGLLPEDQKNYFLNLWNEFEKRKTDEAIFASTLDSVQPLLNHLLTGDKYTKSGKSEDSKILTDKKIISKKRHIQEGSQILWKYSLQIIDESVKKELYLKGE